LIKHVQELLRLEPQVIRLQMSKREQKVKLIEIVKVVQEIRNLLFPRTNEVAFFPAQSAVLNSNKNIFNLCPTYIKILGFSNKKFNTIK